MGFLNIVPPTKATFITLNGANVTSLNSELLSKYLKKYGLVLCWVENELLSNGGVSHLLLKPMIVQSV